MSLKAIHIIFIIAASLFTFGFGGWLMYHHATHGNITFLLLGLFHVLVGVALIVYGKRFLQKLKHVKFM